ncbi:hypothetical protein N656DRAFT_415515 [Canariomyces notabilis]|uniref:Uncharacterized protein n=1 Tax=Canariomyces notabilis TaxID=2074819 RepID=A0AAN6QEJ6_9PEZI|nr:hypothetical protein N656DRAFT_415515 [Canariomyces arenarius]
MKWAGSSTRQSMLFQLRTILLPPIGSITQCFHHAQGQESARVTNASQERQAYLLYCICLVAQIAPKLVCDFCVACRPATERDDGAA